MCTSFITYSRTNKCIYFFNTLNYNLLFLNMTIICCFKYANMFFQKKKRNKKNVNTSILLYLIYFYIFTKPIICNLYLWQPKLALASLPPLLLFNISVYFRRLSRRGGGWRFVLVHCEQVCDRHNAAGAGRARPGRQH